MAGGETEMDMTAGTTVTLQRADCLPLGRYRHAGDGGEVDGRGAADDARKWSL
jgi:hypothetical protein